VGSNGLFSHWVSVLYILYPSILVRICAYFTGISGDQNVCFYSILSPHCTCIVKCSYTGSIVVGLALVCAGKVSHSSQRIAGGFRKSTWIRKILSTEYCKRYSGASTGLIGF